MRSPSRNTVANILLTCALLAVAGFALWDRLDPTTELEPAVPEGILVFAPTFGERLEKALDRLDPAPLGSEAAEAMAKRSGAVMADRPALTTGWPEDMEVRPLLADPELVELLKGQDEDAVAQALSEQGVDVVALRWRVNPSVDETHQVLSRLYHHGDLRRFSLFRITDRHFLYEIREEAVEFPPEVAMFCVAWLRRALAGLPTPEVPDLRDPTGIWDLMATLRGNGRELAIGLAHSRSLERALYELADDLERGHRRYVEWWGFPPLERHIHEIGLEIHLISEIANVEPRGEDDLESLWELGVDGAIIRDYEARESAIFPGAVSYSRTYRNADLFLRRAASFHRLNSRRPWRDPDVSLEMVRSIHYREVPGKGLSRLYRGTPLVPMEAVNLDSIRESVLAAGEWYLTNLQDDGSVLYKFWPAENRFSNEYNIVRHTLATWNMVQAYHLDPRPEFLEGATRALEYTLQYVEHEGDMAYVTFDGNTKLGTVVVGLLGMIELAEVTGDHSHDELMKKFGNFIRFMQREDGSFLGYHVPEDHPYHGRSNDIVPGEAALALVYLHNYFDDDTWLEPLPAYWDYYAPWYEERKARRIEGAPWPRYTYKNADRLELVQFGPWTVMAANAYHEVTGDEDVAALGMDIGRWMIDTYEWTRERAPFPDYVGGYYKLHWELPAMQAFCYAEGTASAYALALRADPEQAPYFEEHTRETMRFAMQMQFDPFDTYPFSRPWQVMGGIRYALNETKVRIDYVHHGLSAMYTYLQAARTDPNLPESVRSPAPTPPGATPEGSQPSEGEGSSGDSEAAETDGEP